MDSELEEVSEILQFIDETHTNYILSIDTKIASGSRHSIAMIIQTSVVFRVEFFVFSPSMLTFMKLELMLFGFTFSITLFDMLSTVRCETYDCNECLKVQV